MQSEWEQAFCFFYCSDNSNTIAVNQKEKPVVEEEKKQNAEEKRVAPVLQEKEQTHIIELFQKKYSKYKISDKKQTFSFKECVSKFFLDKEINFETRKQITSLWNIHFLDQSIQECFKIIFSSPLPDKQTIQHWITILLNTILLPRITYLQKSASRFLLDALTLLIKFVEATQQIELFLELFLIPQWISKKLLSSYIMGSNQYETILKVWKLLSNNDTEEYHWHEKLVLQETKMYLWIVNQMLTNFEEMISQWQEYDMKFWIQLLVLENNHNSSLSPPHGLNYVLEYHSDWYQSLLVQFLIQFETIWQNSANTIAKDVPKQEYIQNYISIVHTMIQKCNQKTNSQKIVSSCSHVIQQFISQVKQFHISTQSASLKIKAILDDLNHTVIK